jgi:cell division septal protein FtsQ
MVADWTTPALARPRLPARSAFVPSRRAVLATGAVLLVLALAYLAARTTPLFAVRSVEVTGAPAPVRAEVETAVARFAGTSLVALDGAELVRRVEALPTVVSARYDRAFPHTLRIFVVPERAVAVVAYRGTRWLVSDSGRVMRRAERQELRAYPRIRLRTAAELTPGETIRDPRTMEPLRALAKIRQDFPVRVHVGRFVDGELTFVLPADAELRLGEPVDLDVKLAAAAQVLAALSGEERARLAYLDVSLPERPVATDKPQVAG